MLVSIRLYAQNNIGIGTNTPAERLHVAGNIRADTVKTTWLRMSGNAPGLGKVLTSDANGNASWQTPVGGGGGTLTDAYNFGGAGAGRIINATTASVRVDGNFGFQVSGAFGGATYIENPFSSGGARLFFATSKGAFRAGALTTGAANALWDVDSVGVYSVAMGYNSNAWSQGGVAIGYNSFARGSRAVALGSGNNAAGLQSFCAGSSNIAIGSYAVAVGFDNSADMNGVAIGRENMATTSAVAIGINNTASAGGAAAIGNFNQASGQGSAALGEGNVVSSNYSMVAGRFSQTTGTYAFSIGESVRARGNWSFAFGKFSESIGSYSGAAGFYSLAKGVQAFAFGEQLVNNGYASLAVGRFNDSIYAAQSAAGANTALFLVGNGTGANNRSNAMVVLSSGNVGIGLNNPSTLLEVDGALAIKVRTQSGNPTVNLDNTASVWYLAGTGLIQLPAANTCPNRQYTLVNTSSSAKAFTASSPAYYNFFGTTSNTIPANSSITIASDGGNWLRIH
ncbi:MAG: hypothetical protein MUF24_13380 [Chitinophagaceae bacterium]|nr:hypothetical protein [Chitinophagaceae bacterium]